VLLSGRKSLNGVAFIQRFMGTVNPSEAKGFLYCVIVGYAMFAGGLFGIYQPHFFFGVEIVFKPISLFSSGFYVKSLFSFHDALLTQKYQTNAKD